MPSTTAAKPKPEQDAIALLKADHREVEDLFSQFEKARSRKLELAREICNALKVHTQIEEEIFYPAVKPKIDEEMVNEAIVEHVAAKDLIAEIEAMDGSEELFEAKMKVLQEQIEHHVEEEEKEMFKEVRDTRLDLKELGTQMATRKEELMAAMETRTR